MSPPLYTPDFLLLSRNVMISVILGAMNDSSLSLFDNSLIYWERRLVGYPVYPERIISCWSLIILLWKSPSCFTFLNTRVARSDWTSPFIPPIRGAHEWRSLDRIFHPDISWAWVMTTLYAWCAMEDFTKVSLVISIGSECPREVYIWTFQEYEGWSRSGIDENRKYSFL